MPSGNKPLPEPILTEISGVINYMAPIGHMSSWIFLCCLSKTVFVHCHNVSVRSSISWSTHRPTNYSWSISPSISWISLIVPVEILYLYQHQFINACDQYYYISLFSILLYVRPKVFHDVSLLYDRCSSNICLMYDKCSSGIFLMYEPLCT